jgi:beta-aspartyl-peptidase (threonine type)
MTAEGGRLASWGHEGGAWALLVHGGAGDIALDQSSRYQAGCVAAVEAGAAVLRAGGSALDAVEKAVAALEDNPLFNAGTGACLNEDGLVELDASIMEGTTLRSGGVCALPPFAHPVSIARAVLEEGRHVLYAGEGAARFAQARGFVPTTSEALTTDAARARWRAARGPRAIGGTDGGGSPGTVGAVARDAHGVLAAATSTGGRLLKALGRVGDSPVPGAGNYADDQAGAVSATGNGEAILRVCLSKTAADLLRAGLHPDDAARAALRLMADRTGGTGGIILIDRLGRLGWARTTAAMTWAAVSASHPGTESGV